MPLQSPTFALRTLVLPVMSPLQILTQWQGKLLGSRILTYGAATASSLKGGVASCCSTPSWGIPPDPPSRSQHSQRALPASAALAHAKACPVLVISEFKIRKDLHCCDNTMTKKKQKQTLVGKSIWLHFLMTAHHQRQAVGTMEEPSLGVAWPALGWPSPISPIKKCPTSVTWVTPGCVKLAKTKQHN